MDSKGAAAAAPTQVYEDFVPTSELVQEQDSDTLLLNLTGFKREQVRVQLTRTGVLKISGQRPAGQNKWLRFQKDFPVSENCDKNKISAKFENGILYVKQPKLITSAEKKEKESPTPATQQPKKPVDHHEQHAQKKDQKNAKHEKTTPREELPKQANAEKPLAKDDAKMGTAAALAEKQKKPVDHEQQPKKPVDHEQHAQKKDQENAKHEKTTPREELPKQANAEKPLAKEPEKQEPKKSEAKELPEKTPAEKAGTSSTAEDGKGTSYESKLENDAKMGTEAALAEKLKMTRKVMNMTLVAILVLGIGLYVSNMMKSNNYQAEE